MVDKCKQTQCEYVFPHKPKRCSHLVKNGSESKFCSAHDHFEQLEGTYVRCPFEVDLFMAPEKLESHLKICPKAN